MIAPHSLELKVKRPPKTLRQLAYDKLREAILHAIFKPGERLVERDLCVQLDVSRTVIREALRQLEADGLVDIVANQGPVVATVGADKVKEIYDIRGLLEGLAASRCAAKGTLAQVDQLSQMVDGVEQAFEEGEAAAVLHQIDRFYEQLFAVAQKPFAWEMVQSLNARINPLRLQIIEAKGQQVATVESLRKIVLAIRAQNVNAAEQACLDRVQAIASTAYTLLTANDPAG